MTLGQPVNMNEMEYKRQVDALRQVYLQKFLHAMKEDLAEWLSSLTTYNVKITPDSFISNLENGVILCQHARHIQRYAEEYVVLNTDENIKIPKKEVRYTEKCAFPGSFTARDNVANFIYWCRELGIPQVVMFETEDLVSHKNEKSVILTLLDVARKAYQFGVEPPEIVKFEQEIDEEIERDKENERLGKPVPKPFDLEARNNLDEMVRNIVDRCTCFDRFPIKKLSEGKYQLGRNNILIFVRIMRKNVMVRVGGGWDTFDHFITKHDPCRMKIGGALLKNIVVSSPQKKVPTATTPYRRSTTSKSSLKSDRTSDSWSMCSGSTDSTGSIDGISKADCHCSKGASKSKRGSFSMQSIDDSISDESDMSVSFTKSIEELDHKLQLLQNSTIDFTVKDTSIYDNKADRWLRNQMNSFKQRQAGPPDENMHPSDEYVLRRGFTADVIERKKSNQNDTDFTHEKSSSMQKIPSKSRSRSKTSNNVLQSCDNRMLPQARGYQLHRQLTSDNMAVRRRASSNQSLNSSTPEPPPSRRSYCDMSTQTENEKDYNKPNLQRQSSLNRGDIGQSRIPRPKLQRSRTSDSISSSRIRKRNLERQSIPRLTREKSNLNSSPKLGLRREKSDLNGGRLKKKQDLKSQIPSKRR